MANVAHRLLAGPAGLFALALAACGGGHGSDGTMMAGAGGAAGVGGAAGGKGGTTGSGAGNSDGGVDATGDGAVSISLTIDRCPTVVADGTPSLPLPNTAVNVNASGTDPDDDPLTYQWSAPSGTFAAPTAPSTSYRCGAPGAVPLTVTVSDHECDARTTLTITCPAVQ
jgi:hypothetical protein